MAAPVSDIDVFDRGLLRLRRDRAAARKADVGFLFDEVADRLMDRLSLVKRQFPIVLDMGAAMGGLTAELSSRAGTDMVVGMDMSSRMVQALPRPAFVADEDFLPLKPSAVDAVISNLALHWVNDLPGALLQAKTALKPDGLFLAAMLGGETLCELRECLMAAELTVTGGASPRVSPFIDPRDLGALMQRAGFALPVVDSDMITVDYAHAFKLMRDLRDMGASNATHNRLRRPTRRAVLMEAARLYHEKFARPDGMIPATFQVVYAIGWRPHESQPQPLKPGSASHRLADALATVELPAGDKVGR